MNWKWISQCIGAWVEEKRMEIEWIKSMKEEVAYARMIGLPGFTTK